LIDIKKYNFKYWVPKCPICWNPNVSLLLTGKANQLFDNRLWGSGYKNNFKDNSARKSFSWTILAKKYFVAYLQN